MQNRLVLISVAILIILIALNTCTKKNYAIAHEKIPVLQYKYEIIQDTLTTFLTKTKIKTDTAEISIEKRINSAIVLAESALKEAVKEKDSVALKLIRLEKTENITVYDTVKVVESVAPDSVMLFNIFEYEFNDGLAVVTKRDTIQSRRVSRAYTQKYITQ